MGLTDNLCLSASKQKNSRRHNDNEALEIAAATAVVRKTSVSNIRFRICCKGIRHLQMQNVNSIGYESSYYYFIIITSKAARLCVFLRIKLMPRVKNADWDLFLWGFPNFERLLPRLVTHSVLRHPATAAQLRHETRAGGNLRRATCASQDRPLGVAADSMKTEKAS